jgi:hypothetical protein
MIEISSPNPVHFAQALNSRGGFAWWYIDAVDAKGNGCVVVWSFGLPFLPGSRKGERAATRPCIHFAAFRDFKPEIYQLTQYEAVDAEISPECGSGRIGRSSFRISEDIAGVRAQLELDEPMSGTSERLRVSLSVSGSSVRVSSSRSSESEEPSSVHKWCPRSVSASASLAINGETWGKDLRAYFDSNASTEGLHLLGIREWIWGRVSFGDKTLVYYEVTGDDGSRRSFLFLDSRDGLVPVSGSLRTASYRRGLYGAQAPRTLEIETSELSFRLSVQAVVDDGPFYQRFLLRGQSPSLGEGSGVGELVIPGKVDVPWQRVFVNMKTLKTSGSNSKWLPLFTGTRGTRLSRLIHSARNGSDYD